MSALRSVRMCTVVALRYYAPMPEPYEFDGADIAELLIQIGRLAYAESGEAGLTPTQWMALRYFARANRFSRTVSAFADYHATTRGTVSQTVKTLTERGYLSRRRSESDGRSVRLDLTEKGRDAIAADPLSRLIGLIDALPSDAQQSLAIEISGIASGLSQALDRPAFGPCRRCRFLTNDEQSAHGSAQASCRYLNEPLDAEELARLCVNYVAASALESRPS